MVQTNLREIDAGLDVEAVLDFIDDMGARAWLLSVGGIISGYPTQLDFQNPNPRLAARASGDLVGDAVEAAHARGVRVLARMDFSKVDQRIAEEHPDWCFVDAQGQQQVYNGLTSVCPSGQYYQAKVFEILDEVLSRYPVDGFFFNWLSFGEVGYDKRYRGVCQCLACRRAFATACPGVGLPVDRDASTYPEWKRFSGQVLAEWTGRARAFIANRRPEAPLIMGSSSDIVFHEANNAIGRPLWHHLCTEHVSVAKTHRPSVPVLVNCAAFVDMPYRLAGEEPHAYAQYLVQAIARGANPSIYLMGTPAIARYECLDTARDLIRFHRANDWAYRGYRPAARTALIRPDRWKPGNTAGAERAHEEFRGLWTMLLERHVPFDALDETRICDVAATGGLDRYQLLVLPDLGRLADDTAAAIDSFVERGGRVLSTGSTGFDGEDMQLASIPVDARLAVKDTPEMTWSSYLLPATGTDGSMTYPLPLIGDYHVVRTTARGRTSGHLLSRAPYGPPEKAYGHVELREQPVWITADHGAGTSVMFPWTVGLAYREVGLSALRELAVDQAIRLLGADLEVVTDLPEQVEVVVACSVAGLLVHLRNLSGAGVQRFSAPLPIGPSRLTIRRPDLGLRTCRALVSGQQLPLEHHDDGSSTIDIPAFGLFEALVLR